jgi:hypothetical protein
MSTIKFETELHGDSVLALRPEIVAQLPKSGTATVVLLLSDDEEDQAWQRLAYEQFIRDDDEEDSIYDSSQ